jgi:hypothetical protein
MLMRMCWTVVDQAPVRRRQSRQSLAAQAQPEAPAEDDVDDEDHQVEAVSASL